MIATLLKHGANVDTLGLEGLAPLHHASVLGQDDTFELFKEINLNILTKDGKTALQLAIENGQFNAVQLLVDMGCDVKVVDNDGNSLLHHAAVGQGNATLYCKYLVEKGLSPFVKNKQGYTPRVYA